ncbi:phage tail sheath family protein [Massilia antarctica]|uniref:phage tail sheath family protein n=1 Tax=Massilia antarctica TaxID=2765360 RepID=UPI0006BB7613|nr:phage tail sheath C-terminal domain-containing protein [Massilia sp. H27-R4]MCY0916469.1 phage tail sheath subtilisin-like domain-containing protein [Massilia sp. H27-R4]CUI07400.1 Phage tail sheath protein FI [Janthinobacterium sp. CG23_2]CUU31186.1 Phage tail sheath protein FI [Janthinobacterium sp. CG23_2]
MPEYLAPGVYIEEVNAGPRPIEGVSTSTAGFVGETERGPTRSRLVTSWTDYQRWYGGYIDRPPLNALNHFLPYAVRGFFENGGQRLFVARVIGKAALAATVSLPGDTGPTGIRAIGPGTFGNHILVAVSQSTAAANASKPGTPPADQTEVAKWFRIQVMYYRDEIPAPFVDPTDPAKLADPKRREPDAYENFDDLSADPTRPNFAKTVINASSFLIEVDSCLGVPAPKAFPSVVLQNGTYVAAALDDFLDDATVDPEARRGLAALCSMRDISLMSIPDEVVINDLAAKLQDKCDAMKDRFAILSDQGPNPNVPSIRPLRDSSYGAYYYPWVRVTAPHTPDGSTLVPANGHITGIYARSDVERGVHKAPANEVVRGIITRDLNGGKRPLSHTLSKQEHDLLNPRGVNVIRDFRTDGRDIRVWGARTMSSDAMWKYINVRRLFIFIEQSIDRGTQWAVFEPNSEITWIALRSAISNFLRTVWRNGALMGTTQDEAFFVKCDRSTMTQDDFDNGHLICLIGIAPVKPAEFVIMRISQKTIEAES